MRILAVDGGGVRGVLPAVWLARLERRSGRPAAHGCDLLAGTSTGSLLAFGLAAGIPARDLVALYRDRAAEVFPPLPARLPGRLLRTLWLGLSQPRYPARGLRRVLSEVFGDALLLRDLPVRTMAVAYDVEAGQPVVFKSWHPAHRTLRVVDVCRASAAAPGYLPGAVVAGMPLIDGGVAANNPSAAALVEGVRLLRARGTTGALSRVSLLSLGTGTAHRPRTASDLLEWGFLEWAPRAVELLMDGQVEVADYLCRWLLAPGAYDRIQARLPEGLAAMDEARNVHALARLARRVARRPDVSDVLDRWAAPMEDTR